DRRRPVARDQVGQACRDLVERGLAGHGGPRAVRATLAGPTETLRVGVLCEQLASLDAQVPLRDRVALVTPDCHRTPVLHVHLDATDGVTEAAEAPMRLDHSRFPYRRSGHGSKRRPPDPGGCLDTTRRMAHVRTRWCGWSETDRSRCSSWSTRLPTRSISSSAPPSRRRSLRSPGMRPLVPWCSRDRVASSRPGSISSASRPTAPTRRAPW